MYKSKKLVLFLLLGVLLPLIFTSSKSAHAANAPSAPQVLVNQSYGFENVLVLGDALFIAPYKTDWNTNLYFPEDILAMLTDYDNNLFSGQLKNPAFVPGGLVAFYLTSADLTSLGITFGTTEVRILLQSNPTSFDNSVNSGAKGNISYIETTTVEETQAEIEERLPVMVGLLQTQYPSDTIVSADRITAAGAQLAVEAFNPIVQVAPNAFSIGLSLIDLGNFNPGDNILQEQINTDTANSRSGLALTGLADGLGLNRYFLGLLILLGISIPTVLGIRRATQISSLGYASLGGLIVWWTYLGLIPTEVVIVTAAMFLAIIGVLIWRLIPIN